MVWIEPSWHCGPFSGQQRMYHVVTHYLSTNLPPKVNAVIDFLTSPGTIIPLIVLLVLIIFYLMYSVSSLREINNDLKYQIKEKDEVEELDEDEILPDEMLSEAILRHSMSMKRSRGNEELIDYDKAGLLTNSRKSSA